MEFLSPQFFSALFAIVVIDLVLAGDNAIVIGLAARSLPPALQKKAIFWGAIGAVLVRAVLTAGVVWLLKIPGFLLVGGLALIWIGYQLLADRGIADSHGSPGAAPTLRQALQTIIVADTVMGVDNVLAVAGAAHGSFLLVLIGLVISIPIVMLGSTLILKWVERFPLIIVFGAGILGWTAAKMIIAEPMLASFLAEHHGWRIALQAFCIGIIVAIPVLQALRGKLSAQWVSLAFSLLWLTVFDHLEETTASRYFPAGDAPPALDLIDLAMWLGWIPFVIMLHTAVSPAAIPGKAATAEIDR
jgi:YjbE family integral membrane protein